MLTMRSDHIATNPAVVHLTNAGVARACPFCSSGSASIIPAFRSGQAREWMVVSCDHCGQMYTDPKPADSNWEEYYPADYGPHCRRTTEPSAGPEPIVRASHVRVPGRFVNPYLFRPFGAGRLLDFGCGSGTYLSRMRNRGWDVLGLERSLRAAQAARSEHDVAVVLGSLPGAELPARSFDLITAWQVIEHVSDPRATVAAIRHLLRPDGCFALTVPNQSSWAARIFGCDWIGWDLPRHLTHFTAMTLTRLLEAEGMTILCQRTIGQSGWIRHSARRREPASITNALLEAKLISRAISACAVHSGSGESLYVVATRSAR